MLNKLSVTTYMINNYWYRPIWTFTIMIGFSDVPKENISSPYYLIYCNIKAFSQQNEKQFLCKTHPQELWSVSKEAFWLWPCWTPLELCCPLPTSHGMTPMPQMRRGKRAGGAGLPPLPHLKKVKIPSSPCCVRRNRPRWWPCRPKPASTNTTSQRRRSCCGLMLCRWPERTASPASVLMGISWLWGVCLYLKNIWP